MKKFKKKQTTPSKKKSVSKEDILYLRKKANKKVISAFGGHKTLEQ